MKTIYGMLSEMLEKGKTKKNHSFLFVYITWRIR